MVHTRNTALLFLIGAGLGPAPARAQEGVAKDSRARQRVHVIAMVEQGQYGIAFEPQRTRALLGDTVRFVQQGVLPHNVMFRSVPAGAELGAAHEGPLITAPGATYDLVLDHRFVAGKYLFVCTPHETLGMAGLLYVDPAEAGP
jgi:plastocyanin